MDFFLFSLGPLKVPLLHSGYKSVRASVEKLRDKMAVVESLLQFPSTGTLLGAFLLLLVLYLLSSGSKSQKKGKEPPGPKPLPLLGNLLTLDLTRPFDTFFEVRT